MLIFMSSPLVFNLPEHIFWLLWCFQLDDNVLDGMGYGFCQTWYNLYVLLGGHLKDLANVFASFSSLTTVQVMHAQFFNARRTVSDWMFFSYCFKAPFILRTWNLLEFKTNICPLSCLIHHMKHQVGTNVCQWCSLSADLFEKRCINDWRLR